VEQLLVCGGLTFAASPIRGAAHLSLFVCIWVSCDISSSLIGEATMFLTRLLIFVTLGCIGAHAQGMSGVQKVVKPGDALHYYVAFDSPLKGDASVSANLILQTPIEQGQLGFSSSWTASQSHKVSETLYEVDTIVPQTTIASGLYRLAVVFVNFKSGGSKAYNYLEDFKNDNTFQLVNDEHHEYPKIKSVTPEPPK
jgi:hypothetical protein